MDGKLPRTVLVVKVKEAYIHCSRALVRAGLWNPAKFAAPGSVPTLGRSWRRTLVALWMRRRWMRKLKCGCR